MDERPKKHRWITVTLFVFIALLGFYFAGYFGLCRVEIRELMGPDQRT